MKLILLLFSVVTLTQCGLVDNEDSVSRLVVGTFMNCMNSDMSLCLKEQALKAAERLGSVRQLKITDRITLINNAAKESRSLEPLSSELEVRKQQVTQRLWESTSDLFRNSDLEYSFDDDDEEDESRAFGEAEEGRSKKKKEKKKKLKLLISLAILAKVKAAALVLLFLGVMAASLYKIALILKIAFIAKVISIIKAIIAKKHGGGQEHWGPPAEEHHGGGWESAGGGWSRSRNEAQNMAYSAHRK